MTRAVGNGMIQTLANAIGTGAVGKLAKQVAGISTDLANIKSPDKGSGLMFNPDTGKLYIPCGNGVTVNKNTGMLEVPIGEHLRYTGSGLDVPDADETTAGVVKLTHEVSNRDDGEWAVTADGVYAYTLGYTVASSQVIPEPLIDAEVSFCRATPGFLFFEFFLRGESQIPKNTDLLKIPGYMADASLVLFSGRYFSFANKEDGIVVSSLNDLPVTDYSVLVPAHKI